MISKNKKVKSNGTSVKKVSTRKQINTKPILVKNEAKQAAVKKNNTIEMTCDVNWAKKAGVFALVIGIIEILTIIVQVVNVILQTKGQLSNALYKFSQTFVSITSIVELAFIIIILCQWRSIKNATKLNYLWVTVGYPVILGIALVFSLVMSFLPTTISVPQVVGYILVGIAELFNFLLASLSICIFCAIKKTVHE